MNAILDCIRSARFLIGLGVGFGFWVLVLLIRAIAKGCSTKYVKQLVKKDERGTFAITLDAVRSFLSHLLEKEFPHLELVDVKLPANEDGATLKMSVKFQLEGNVLETKNALYNRIERAMQNELSVKEQVKEIDVTVIEFTADETEKAKDKD